MKEPYSLHIPSCSHGSTNAQVPSVQGDWDIRQRKLFGPKEMGSVGVGPDRSIVITKYTVLVTSWERGRKLSGKSHCGLSTWGALHREVML